VSSACDCLAVPTDTDTLFIQDCLRVDPIVQRIFGPPDGPEALIVYVGQKTEYVAPPPGLTPLLTFFFDKMEATSEQPIS
jgi:hypothetical protein